LNSAISRLIHINFVHVFHLHMSVLMIQVSRLEKHNR
jgi:hypothetical protein